MSWYLRTLLGFVLWRHLMRKVLTRTLNSVDSEEWVYLMAVPGQLNLTHNIGFLGALTRLYHSYVPQILLVMVKPKTSLSRRGYLKPYTRKIVWNNWIFSFLLKDADEDYFPWVMDGSTPSQCQDEGVAHMVIPTVTSQPIRNLVSSDHDPLLQCLGLAPSAASWEQHEDFINFTYHI